MEGERSLNQPAGTKWTDLSLIPAGPRPHTLANSDIHLWLIHLQVPAETFATCAALLSPDETARAERFRFPHLRNRYTITRGVARQILASYLNTTPEALHFQYSPAGKPSLTQETNPHHLTFNISHSQNLAILGIAKNHRIGIDLEHREIRRDLDQIAARNFSPSEAAAIASLPIEQRTHAFYACWTLKEAYLKAVGEGLSTSLDSFEVHFPPIAPPALAGIASFPSEHLRWRAYSFTLDHHAAALIAEGQRHSIYRAVWNPLSEQTP